MTDNRTLARRPAGRQGTRAPHARDLLAWYDRHRRALPWRALPGEHADPYRVWLSEIMLQQTTVKAVGPYFAKFLALWPDVGVLAASPVEEVMKAWAGLGYYSRARNLHACAKAVVADHGGLFPASLEDLRALPGIGDYTAAAIASIAFGIAAPVVDGNVERVVTRLNLMETPLPAAKPAIRARVAELLDSARPGDFAQATMDLGATICTPKRPACALCPWTGACRAEAEGRQEEFPVKAARKARDTRYGAAFVVVSADGKLLVRTRPDKGLLGGMTEVPGSDWSAGFDPEGAEPPIEARFRRLAGTVTHVFTHFPLELTVSRADVRAGTRPPAGMRWIPLSEVAGEAFPTLMRKVIAHAMGDGDR
ncbi:A/G-specific adenine glycosylase [Phreatobacter aquaticus]|uniref:Adenine DNA glycosylase n=1 Tax=Phreatobacter aquaticus TaxID=2570229 RepID=A0A4D7QE62_9HYPH|nr:A/G-specific adenine glycosylase [Phreatobacter aquaticus]QCK85478.1 A/G-specific adenine glycosylase [Phreatobacter aquaticus]